jgi:membrane complex biogenesis BtpA family protein
VTLLVGVIHLPALPGSPRAEPLDRTLERIGADARALAEAGFDAAMVENFGDVPFFAGSVPPVTIAAMTACALEVKRAAPQLELGINVLRNDGEAAMSIAHVTGASCVRINVLSGARVTDQGVISSRAAEVQRLRTSLGAERVKVWADVDVKHSHPLGPEATIEQQAKDLELRALADAIIVTGSGTGAAVDPQKLARVRAAVSIPVLVGSGATAETVKALLEHASGIIVGSALRDGGRAGGPILGARAAAFARAVRG